MMKKNVFILLLLVCVAFTASSQDTAGDRRGRRTSADNANAASFSFSVQNNTGFIVRRIFIRKTGDTSWGENILRQPQLRSGESITINLEQPLDGQCSVRMQDTDGDYYSQHDITINNGSEIIMVIRNLEL